MTSPSNFIAGPLPRRLWCVLDTAIKPREEGSRRLSGRAPKGSGQIPGRLWAGMAANIPGQMGILGLTRRHGINDERWIQVKVTLPCPEGNTRRIRVTQAAATLP